MKTLNPETIFNPSEFYIPTPMIANLVEQIHTWLWNGITGGVILGNYRIGKTRAVKYASNNLVNRSGESIPAHHISISQRDQNTIASVYRNLCLSLNLKPKTRTTSDQMANDLIYYFGEASLNNSTRQYVLFVDEFQRLHLRQLHAFAELYDKLAEIEVNLCVVFIGNSASSQPLIDSIMEPFNELIRGRFFTKGYIYHGIRNHENLKNILSAFDSKIIYQESPTSITKYFVGKEVPANWKLSSLSHEIWSIYNDEYKSRLKIDSWGMQYFIATIKLLLVDYLPKYGVDNHSEVEEMIRQSIEVSGLVPDLVRAA